MFSPAAPLGKRVMTFANHKDTIHYRHYNYEEDNGKRKTQEGEEGYDERDQDNEDEDGANTSGPKEKSDRVQLSEAGPRFSLQLYKVDLGTLDMKDAKTEWVLRPYFNKQRSILS